MKSGRSFRRLVILALAAFLTSALICCSCTPSENGGTTLLSFKSAASYDYLKRLDGTEVTIKGWLATSSPVDGSFIFLMNMPYQSCPFCKPNTTQLSNTMEVYPKSGKSFEYTTQVVQVVGTLSVAPENKPYTDKYGYEFNYKIVDAEYFLIDDGELSPELVLWQKVANSDIVTEIYTMFDYLNFVCKWPTYTSEFEGGKDYLYPDDLNYFLYKEGSQYNYGYKEGYFESIISKIEKIDKGKLSDLVAIINKAAALSRKALSEIENKNFSAVKEYTTDRDGSLVFGDGRSQYKMNDDTLIPEFESIYEEFYNWFSGWEL